MKPIIYIFIFIISNTFFIVKNTFEILAYLKNNDGSLENIAFYLINNISIKLAFYLIKIQTILFYGI